MKRYLLILVVIVLAAPLFYYSSPNVQGSSSSIPFAPHETSVLVVSPGDIYAKGGHYLISDLASYGFNVTQSTSNDASVNYLNDSKTSDLNQYDVVILHGSYLTLPPTRVSPEEVNHFTDYSGTLIVIGDALFANESSQQWPYYWDNNLQSAPIQKLEQRLGVDFTAETESKNGTLGLVDGTFKGPLALPYITTSSFFLNYQFAMKLNGAREIYSFTTSSGESMRGVTYFRNSTGAVGIYIQGAYVFAPPESPTSYNIHYLGFTNISARSRFIASLIAYALGVDIDTVIKPQGLATVRLDMLGGRGWDETYLNATLNNFNSIISKHGITPTVSFTDYLNQYYWGSVPNVLLQLNGRYRDWEYSSSLRNDASIGGLSQDEIENLIQEIKGNYTALNMDLFRTVATFGGYWNQTTLDAMANENLYLLDTSDFQENLATYYSDWWTLRAVQALSSSVIVHSSARMGLWGENAYFTQIDPDPDVAKMHLYYEYFSNRDKWALEMMNGFPSFAYSVWHFSQNEIGPFSFTTVYSNLTADFPDVRFVPLCEAGLYFGNKWMHVVNPSRIGSTIEFDIDSSSIPNVVSVGKGMLWLRIDTNDTVQEVAVDGKPWFYFDDHSIRFPSTSQHLKITLGSRTSPTVIRTAYNVSETTWSNERFTVTLSATPGLNVSIELSIPLLDAFCSANQWGYRFDAATRILRFWAISDGLIVFRAGADVSPPIIVMNELPPTTYDTGVSVEANVTDSGTGVRNVVLSYSGDLEWKSLTMVEENGLFKGVIPSFPYGTLVHYKLNASDAVGNWRATPIFDYRVDDNIPPLVRRPQWNPGSPTSEQPILVIASVSEPENASGVQRVVLFYYVNNNIGEFKVVNMTISNGIWQAIIPRQSQGTIVSFSVTAYDKAGNIGVSPDTYTFTVGVGASSFGGWQTMLLIGAALAIAVIGTVIYLTKLRKAKDTDAHPKLQTTFHICA